MPKLQRYYPQEDAATARANMLAAARRRKDWFPVACPPRPEPEPEPEPDPPPVIVLPVRQKSIPEKPSWFNQCSRVLAAVSEYYQKPVDLLLSQRRVAPLCRARHMYVWICTERRYGSYGQVARGMGRKDHTTTVNSRTWMRRKLLAADMSVVSDLAAIEASLGLGTANE